MSFSKIATTSLALFAGAVNAAYTLQHDYTSNDFFGNFSFMTDPDPTHGTVMYVDQATASQGWKGGDPLIKQNSDGSWHMAADSQATMTGSDGRPSVRITSNYKYNSGLFILQLSHMPGAECGSWPAFWLLGSAATWPAAGEVDIIEGVNNQIGNDMTLHTSPGCKIENNGLFNGILNEQKIDCNGGGGADGCQIMDQKDAPTAQNSFGSGFNANGGGIYATEWNTDNFKIWFFPKGSPHTENALSDTPDPSQWSSPIAAFTFGGSCNVPEHFVDQQIVFDLTFCGDWAGRTTSADDGWNLNSCSSNGACPAYVQGHPEAFTNAYWTINSLKVYQGGSAGGSGGNGSSSVPPVSSSLPTVVSSIAPPVSSSVIPPVISSVVPSVSSESSIPIPQTTASTSSIALPPSSTVYSTTFATVTAAPPSVVDTTTAVAQSTGAWSYHSHHYSHWTILGENSDGAVIAEPTDTVVDKAKRHMRMHRRRFAAPEMRS
ncbi:MAG: hypothetical protein M1820_002764 [Bogoriella megaspora]|nr:MAG: hypothetical protein M1820_002764 [Bogoriella megaspora]